MKANEPDLSELTKLLSDKVNGYRESILLLVANKYELFTFLQDKSLPSTEIAAQFKWDPRSTERFLNALAGMGLLTKAHGRYANSHLAERLLVKDSPDYQGDILKHNLHLLHRWIRVEEVLQTGIPLRDPKKKRSPEELRAFIDGMSNIARLSAVRLWKSIDLNGRRKLLDAGGGPGTYSFYACEFFPELEAVVFDLPEVESIFNEHRNAAGMQQRVSFAAGDVHVDPLPNDCDVALLSNVIHSWSYNQNQAMIDKLDAVLEPGALLLIKDFYISEDGTEPLSSTLFAVNMLIGTQEGTCYTLGQVESWLENTNFELKGEVKLTEQSSVLLVEKR